MFKVAVFALVLTLVGGRPATLLCGAWCDRSQLLTTCDHDEAAPAVAPSTTDACSGADLFAGLMREENWRVAQGHEQDLQLPSAVAQLVRSERSLLSRDAASGATPLQRRPFSTQLRI